MVLIMLPSIESSRKTLSGAWWFMCVLTAMMSVLFFLPLSLIVNIPTPLLLAILGGCICVGLAMGIFVNFRSRFGTSSALWGFIYLVVVLEVMLSGGAVMLLTLIVDHPSAFFLAFVTNALAMLLSMLGGMLQTAKSFGMWNKETRENWRNIFNRYINYEKRQVNPLYKTNIKDEDDKGKRLMSSFWIVAVGTTNIPLLFEIYGGGRQNAIFLAAPMLMIAFAYVNLKAFGPTLMRILLLRKLEKEKGYRFQNADYEQIQELRRGFFLAKWLMKDYRLPQAETSNFATAAQQEQTPRQRKQRRR